MKHLSSIFCSVKFIILLISVILLIKKPTTVKYVLAVNIAVAIFETSKFNALFGLSILIWSLFVEDKHIIPFLIAYCIWNSMWYYQHEPYLTQSIIQVLVPLGVALMYNKNILHTFVLLRVCILLVLGFRICPSFKT